ncbi:MAG: type II 3-dehydroquinate dehydratase [Actinobacteria bacterium]|nr:MAG: type II 3-dehydroquinate dehydratase [Actinomycetota bacterium]
MAPRPLVLVINGPNLDKLGTRSPEIYGSTTLAELEKTLTARAEELGMDVEFFQANDESVVVDAVGHASQRGAAAILINPAALTHFSYPLREALAATGLRVVEVHISNIHAREPFRRLSLVSGVAKGTIVGLGVKGYALALEAIAGMVGVPRDGV